jgi:polyisoprenoid-binding protein YceI
MATSAQTPESLQAKLGDGSLAGHWTLDPGRSSATLRSKSVWGLVTVKGTFGQLEGNGVISPEGAASGSIKLAADSLDTKQKKRDAHLRSADFFHSDEHPHITFTVDKVVPADEGVTVSGTLAVRDRSRPITFPATVGLAGDGEIALDATVQVDRSEFGLTWNQLGMSSMKNTIGIHAVFTKD